MNVKCRIKAKGSRVKGKGFTLVETILAIAVIGLVITAAADLTASSLKIGRVSFKQFTAFHLAEEGLEIMRAARDSNWLQNRVWNHGLGEGLYHAEIITNRLPSDSPWQLQLLARAEDAPGIILSGEQTFKRIIKIDVLTDEDTDKEVMRIISSVDYRDGGTEKHVELAMELTDWKKGPL